MQLIMRLTAAALLAWTVAATATPAAAEDGEVALVRLLQSNVELRGQVSELTKSVDAMKSELQALRKAVEDATTPHVAVSRPEPEKPQKTAVCPCQRGAGERGCFCLKKGQACQCPTKGSSVWNVTEAGAPISKTGERVSNSRPSQPAQQTPRVKPPEPTQMVRIPLRMQSNCPNCQRSHRFDDDD